MILNSNLYYLNIIIVDIFISMILYIYKENYTEIGGIKYV